ncbi:hypothetical protein BUALT_Bualt16G0068600 [Buddleja alternifolia]|uniref:ADP-ribosylation factor GTPase-activating protein AGD14 n=1 Tax=Buddleja alternifolia TaxID=168488 RepID=A0AAV6W7H1_9LAMI|nr:hypothetical protein BUALT_Bualt16G0068600 [Buddleja alternifolia]
MAKFTPQEVSALQGGGNASAREIYLKEWDLQRNSLPDGSNIERLRDFIKHVYVDRRYTGERNLEKPPRAKMGESGDFNGNRRIDTYQGGSRSPPYEDTFERRHNDRRSPGGRSPGYDQEIRQNSDYKRSPVHAEVVNDWRREDRFGNGRSSEDRCSDGGSKLEVRSPDSQKESDISSPPVVRPVRDILGDNISPLRVIEPPKPIVGKSTDGSVHSRRTESSSSLASSDGKPSEMKVEASFIDFDSVPEPPITVNVPRTQQEATDASAVQLTASSNDNWANFDSLHEVKVYTAASNSMESVLSELSVPAPTSGPSGGSQNSSFGSSFGSIAPLSVLSPSGAPATAIVSPPQLANVGGSLLPNAPAGGQWPNMKPQQHSVFPGGIGQPVPQLAASAIDGSLSNKVCPVIVIFFPFSFDLLKEVINLNFKQPWNPLVGPNAHGSPGASSVQVGRAEIQPAMGSSFGSATESSLDPKSVGRKALPEDLFTVNYPYTPSPVSGWYSGSPYVAGVPMQYNMPTGSWAVPNFQPVSRSANPFDFGGEPASAQASKFPTMTSLQGALPNAGTPFGLVRGNPSFLPQSVRTQAPAYPSAISPSSYVGQEIAGSMAPRPLGLAGFSLEESAFVSLHQNHQHSAPAAPSNFTSAGGNPFG